MIKLTIQQRNDLYELVVSAYDEPSLIRICRLRMGFRLGDEVKIGRPFPDVCLALLEYLERSGELDVFLRESVKSLPNRADFKEFCDTHFPDWVQIEKASDLVSSLGTAVKTVTESLDNPQIRMTVGRFRADFERIEQQIQVLSRYKQIHELLHLLQRQLPNLIRLVSRFPDDVDARKQLSPARMRLSQQVQLARQYSKALPTEPLEEYWIADLEFAATASRRAWDEGSQREMIESIDVLRRVVAQLPRIDGQLTVVVMSIPLGTLLDALQEVSGTIVDAAEPQSAAARRLEEGRYALAVLRPSLFALVNQHNEWQWLDHEMSGIEFNLGIRPKEKMFRWEAVRPRLLDICKTFQGDEWADQIVRYISAWETHVLEWEKEPTSKLSVECEINADSLRNYATNRFVDVDASLRELCEDLIEIGAPLNALLEAYFHDND